jgi:ketosteroid isomerase-like protein
LRNKLANCLTILRMLALAICTMAQSPTPPLPPRNNASAPDDLFQTISGLDTQVFDAIDRCDMKAEASFWADDAEFYHDKNGLMVGGPQIVDAIKNNLCRKVKRELVPGTLEVYPLAGYGAVEIGVHRFLHPWEQDHGVIGEAKFIHIWQHKDGTWKITRVISIDHHEVN